VNKLDVGLVVFLLILLILLVYGSWLWVSALTAFPTNAIANVTLKLGRKATDLGGAREVVHSAKWIMVTLSAAIRGSYDETRVGEIRNSVRYLEIAFSEPVWVWSRGWGAADSRHRADRILITLSSGPPKERGTSRIGLDKGKDS